MSTKTFSKKTAIIIGVALIAAIWIGTFTAMAIMQPDLKTRMLIMAGGAAATELVLYVGAAWFGINLFQTLRTKWRARKD